uniref:6-Cys domain-containing protein n=1 Tax=Babesia bovis TaxID=5865 RepID=A0A0S3J420_BABBO|nr:hypothetical protein [Babesia bovis]
MVSQLHQNGSYLSLFTFSLLFTLLKISNVENITLSHVTTSQKTGETNRVDFFSNETDLNPGDNLHQVVRLEKGDTLFFTCGSDAIFKNGTVERFPKNPLKYTLPSQGEYEGTKGLAHELPNHNIFRSDVDIISSYEDEHNGTRLRITYPSSAVIMAKRPDNFTLNYACKYQPHDDTKPASFKFLEVRFDGVYPMAYGCESSDSALFLNGIPQEDESISIKRQRRLCYIDPIPNMIIGIYCKPGDHLYPSRCFQEAVLDAQGFTTRFNKSYIDPDFPYQEFPERFRLIKLSHDFDKKAPISCSCVDRNGKMTKKLIIEKPKNAEVNIMNLVNRGIVSLNKPPYLLSYILSPGMHLTFLVNNSSIKLRNGEEAYGWISPKNAVQDIGMIADDGKLVEIPLSDAIGSKGFYVGRTELYNGVSYRFVYDDNGIVVLKKPDRVISYGWVMLDSRNNARTHLGLALAMYIVPTDPYTYGCGVDSADLFHKEGFLLSFEYDQVPVTKCKVNPYLSSPVGFYCPEGFVLEPPNCFSEMLHKDKEVVVPLSDFEPLARALEGRHIKVADFHTSTSNRDHIRYSSVELMCRCLDREGQVHASITLDLRKPRTRQLGNINKAF